MDKRSWPWKKKTSERSPTFTDADEKVRRLNEQLLAADELAKQHATVAEEAVSGWEKTKAEYLSVKYQLDTAIEQKQAAEVRVFHLDATLKECMQQLRQGREEQEQAIHEAIIKRSREWDKLRLDLEERLADVEGQLMNSESQRTLIYKMAQEQAEAAAELSRIRSEEEVEIKKQRVQVQTLEKENTSLKYEIVVLNKELGIRNQEREMNSRSLDMASQQHIENSKRIAKLETECQRLRTLVRKKLPGPGALLQMKLEAGMDAERGDTLNKRKVSGRAPASLKAAHAGSPHRSPKMGHGLHVTDSLLVKEHTRGAMSEDSYDDDQSVAESWTSSTITEPSSFQRERLTLQQPSNLHPGEGLRELNSIDNFLAIERFVSLPPEKQGVKPIIKAGKSTSDISEQVLTKDAELEAAITLSPEASRAIQGLNLSEDATCDQRVLHLREGSQVEHITPELTILICKIIRIVKDLASKSLGDSREFQPSDDVNGHNDINSKPKLQLSELEATLKSLTAAGNEFLYGKAELVRFMTELYSMLNQLNALPKAYKLLSSRMKWRPEGVQIAEQEVISDVDSPFSSSSTSDRSDSLARKDSSIDEGLASRKLQVEKGTSEARLREEPVGLAAKEHVIADLKREKLELEIKLKEERGKLDLMKGQLLESEQLVACFRARLASAELSGIVAEKSLSSITAVKAQLELRLQDSQLELGRLRAKVKDLELQNEQERRRNRELQMKGDLQSTVAASNSHDDMEKSYKEQEIADATEKLAECQRTIFVLGQQLKDIASPADGNQFVTYLNQAQDNTANGNSIAAVPKTLGLIDPKVCNVSVLATHELIGSPMSAESGLQRQAFDSLDEENTLHRDHHRTKSYEDAEKQIVPYNASAASKKKSNLHSLAASAMSKSLNLEPSASPRKHANSFSKYFSRHKNPS